MGRMSERQPPLDEEPAGHPIPALREPADESGSSALPAERETLSETTRSQETEVQQPTGSSTPPGHDTAPNMLPGRPSRGSGLERFVVRLVATGGVIGIGVGMAAILAANHVQGWIIGLAVSAVSVLLSAILWSSRQM